MRKKESKAKVLKRRERLRKTASEKRKKARETHKSRRRGMTIRNSDLAMAHSVLRTTGSAVPGKEEVLNPDIVKINKAKLEEMLEELTKEKNGPSDNHSTGEISDYPDDN